MHTLAGRLLTDHRHDVALWYIKESGRYLLESEMKADPARMTPEMWWPKVKPYITAYRVSNQCFSLRYNLL
jgi:hypothetical protein